MTKQDKMDRLILKRDDLMDEFNKGYNIMTGIQKRLFELKKQIEDLDKLIMDIADDKDGEPV